MTEMAMKSNSVIKICILITQVKHITQHNGVRLPEPPPLPPSLPSFLSPPRPPFLPLPLHHHSCNARYTFFRVNHHYQCLERQASCLLTCVSLVSHPMTAAIKIPLQQQQSNIFKTDPLSLLATYTCFFFFLFSFCVFCFFQHFRTQQNACTH